MDLNLKIENRIKINQIVYGTIICGLIIFFVQFLFFTKSKAENELDEITTRLNSNTPHEIDKATLVEAIFTMSSSKVRMNICLPKISKSIFQTESFKDSTYSRIGAQISKDEYFKPLLQKNVEFIIDYCDKNASPLFTLNLKAEQYK